MEQETKMESRGIILPGEFIDDKKGRKVGRGTFFEGEKVYSKVLGIPRISENEIYVIPLSGVYIPVTGDRVIGVIQSTELSGWFVDLNSPYSGFMPLSEAVDEFVDLQRTELSRFFDVNDIVFAKISRVTKNKTVQVSMREIGSKKLYGGILLKVTPSKVPRIIGKGGSMIQLIKSKTKCDLITGQNGLVWIRGDDKTKAIEAILTIEKESHTSGLTEKIDRMLGE